MEGWSSADWVRRRGEVGWEQEREREQELEVVEDDDDDDDDDG